MQARLDALTPEQEQRREFLGTYQRTTIAVGKAVEDGVFEDGPWVEDWDVAFADLYLDALDADLAGTRVPRPWRLALRGPPPDLHATALVLLGINAHINYDLPQALLAVISDADFADPGLLDRRRRDHERIDGVLSGRVAAEDAELARSARTLLDRLLQPLTSRRPSGSSARPARRCGTTPGSCSQARMAGPDVYAERLAGGAAERREDRRPARTRAGAAATGGRRVRSGAAAAGLTHVP